LREIDIDGRKIFVGFRVCVSQRSPFATAAAAKVSKVSPKGSEGEKKRDIS